MLILLDTIFLKNLYLNMYPFTFHKFNLVQNYYSFEYLIVVLSLLILLIIPRYAKLFWNIDKKPYLFSKEIKERVLTVDILKGIAILGVVIIHSFFILIYFSPNRYLSVFEIISFSFLNNLLRFVIAVFLFTSGLLLKPFVWTKKAVFVFYKNKFVRIIIPYMILTIFFWLIGYKKEHTLADLLLTGDVVTPLYFIPLLLQFYLIYPILDIIRKFSPRLLLVLALLISLFSYLNPVSWRWLNIVLFWPYLVFFVYGMLRKNILIQKTSSKWNELVYICVFLQLLIIFSLIFVGIDIKFFRYFTLYFYNTQYVFGFAVILSLFKFFKENQNLLNNMVRNSLAKLGKISLWIFLLHYPILEFLFNKIYLNEKHVIIDILVNNLLTLIIVIPLSYLLDKIYTTLVKAIKLN